MRSVMDSVVLKKRGYTLGTSLGEGSYGKVKSAYSAHLNTNVAIKIINKKRAPLEFLQKFLPRELEILAALNHRNIVRTFEIFETSEGKVYMVMELGVQGDLLELIQQRKSLPEDFSRKLFSQFCHGMKFIHDLNIVHRDLKCENLLLDKDFNLKISDFGFSRRLQTENNQVVLSRTFCGSAAYSAPEVLQSISYNPKVSDVWSMGVVLFIMMCGCMPYDDSNIKEMLKIQKKHRVDFPRSKNVSAECKDLICRILHPNVHKRIQIHNILEHSWLQSKTSDSRKKQQDGASTSKACDEEHKPVQDINKHQTDEEPSTSEAKSPEEPKPGQGQENTEEPKTAGPSSTNSSSKDLPVSISHLFI